LQSHPASRVFVEPRFQRDRVVVRLVARGIKQRDSSLVPQQIARGGGGGLARQLLAVGPNKPLPVVRISMELASQCVAWRKLLRPEIDLCRLALDAARPEPVDEDAKAVLARRLRINALELERGCHLNSGGERQSCRRLQRFN